MRHTTRDCEQVQRAMSIDWTQLMKAAQNGVLLIGNCHIDNIRSEARPASNNAVRLGLFPIPGHIIHQYMFAPSHRRLAESDFRGSCGEDLNYYMNVEKEIDRHV